MAVKFTVIGQIAGDGARASTLVARPEVISTTWRNSETGTSTIRCNSSSFQNALFNEIYDRHTITHLEFFQTN